MSDAKVGKVASLVWKFALDLANELGDGAPATKGWSALTGFAAITRKVAGLLERGHSVDEILKGMAQIPEIVLPWRKKNDDEKTQPATPSAKKRET